jgi:hypothetical protein
MPEGKDPRDSRMKDLTRFREFQDLVLGNAFIGSLDGVPVLSAFVVDCLSRVFACGEKINLQKSSPRLKKVS